MAGGERIAAPDRRLAQQLDRQQRGLGAGFLTFALAFARRRSLKRARGVLRASLIYLPVLLALLLLDGASH